MSFGSRWMTTDRYAPLQASGRRVQANKFQTVEALAASVKLHPKVVRQELRYAFLAPTITEAILTGDQPRTLSLARIPKTLPLAWSEQCRVLGF